MAQDRLDDAHEIAAFAARGVPEEDPHSSAWLSLIEAWVATAAGERAAAAGAFAEAVRLFEELNYPLDLADARFAFARSLLTFGEVVGGRNELERARSIYARVGADVRRDAVDAELGGAGRGAGSRRSTLDSATADLPSAVAPDQGRGSCGGDRCSVTRSTHLPRRTDDLPSGGSRSSRLAARETTVPLQRIVVASERDVSLTSVPA